MLVLGLGYTLFLGTVIWIATFPSAWPCEMRSARRIGHRDVARRSLATASQLVAAPLRGEHVRRNR
jgi:hypothetical protein